MTYREELWVPEKERSSEINISRVAQIGIKILVSHMGGSQLPEAIFRAKKAHMKTKKSFPQSGPRPEAQRGRGLPGNSRVFPSFQKVTPVGSTIRCLLFFFFLPWTFIVHLISSEIVGNPMWFVWGLIGMLVGPFFAEKLSPEELKLTWKLSVALPGLPVPTVGKMGWQKLTARRREVTGPESRQKQQMVDLLMYMIIPTAGHPDVLQQQALACRPRFTPDSPQSLCPCPRTPSLYRTWIPTCPWCADALRFGARVKENSLGYKSSWEPDDY